MRKIQHGHPKSHPRHGMSYSEEYRAWTDILYRCRNPKSPIFKHYGGRGITVCDEWATFEQFFADMGPRPPGHSIDRINNDRRP